MNTMTAQKSDRNYRIPLTDALVARFADRVFDQPAPLLARRTAIRRAYSRCRRGIWSA
jgi:hypothetical protein